MENNMENGIEDGMENDMENGIEDEAAEKTAEERVRAQRAFFETGITGEWKYRYMVLGVLKQAILEKRDIICGALQADLNKSETESYMTEVGLVLQELGQMMRHLRRWTGKRRVSSPLALFPGKSYVVQEPYGVVLVMAPWNYPFLLAMMPLIGALAAGNCVLLKPSKDAPHTAAVLAELIHESFEPCLADVVLGGREENRALLQQRFDMIFFTGGKTVGKVVLEAAAQHLTPVVLELGGKSPCIVDETADLPLAAKRIVFGKFLNAGQTCVAPDYLLVQSSVKDVLLEEIKKAAKAFYGDDPLANGDYPRMVNRRHYDRVLGLLAGENVVLGGRGNEATLQIAPTVAEGVAPDSPLMQEEIFGPVLPVLTYEDGEEALEFVRERPKPLALYLFTRDKKTEKRIMGGLSFGGGCVNDTVMQLSNLKLPFGGVGESGMGSYHGRGGLAAFGREKSIVRRGSFPDVALRYPPYSEKKLKLIKKIIK